MRKVIVFSLIMFAILGGILHYSITQKIIKGEYVSEYDASINLCAQDILWLPFSVGLGFSLLLFPNKLIKWFVESLSSKTKPNIKQINTITLRLFGLLLLITTPISPIISNCKILFDI